MAKAATAAPKPKTKSEVMAEIAEKTGLTKRDIQGVFDEMGVIIKRELGRKGPGMFTIPGLLKLTVRHKPATKARPGKNPFTGEDIMIKAKPASKTVKATPLKALKDMV